MFLCLIFLIVFSILDKTEDIMKAETEKINKSLNEASSSKLVTPQKVETEKTNKSLNETNSSTHATPQRKSSSSCDKKVPESNSIDDFAHDIVNGDDSAELIDISMSKTNLLYD